MKAESFTDPKVEGTFFTAASRSAVDEYIQNEIKNHEIIIRYYKERHNTLNFTCRLPREILGTIFEQVVDCRQTSYKDRSSGNEYWSWIKSVSHVCSHWRAVALSSPTLWSNIWLMMNPAWIPEMIQRSKRIPLKITLSGAPHLRDPIGSYLALKEVIRSHLPYLKSLTLTLSPDLNTSSKAWWLDRFSELLPLLDQPAPMLECLDIDFDDAEIPKQLPNGFVVGLSQLKHLRLEGLCLEWELSALENLKSLVISCLLADRKPTVKQLLDMVTRTPLLESLTIMGPYVLENTSLPQNVAPICLEHLKHIDIAYSLPDCAFFFDHIIPSTQTTIITIRLPTSSNVRIDGQSAFAAIRTLVRRLDIEVKGPIFELKIENEIQCCKSNGSQKPFVINIDGLCSYLLPPGLKEAFWQSLCLDQLVSLDIFLNPQLSMDTWSLFGALPFLRSLRVKQNELVLLSILEGGTVTRPDVPALFVSLKSLTLSCWYLCMGRKRTVQEWMVTCFDCRRKADLRLETLVLVDPVGTRDKKLLDHLRGSIDRVDLVFDT